MAQTIPYEQDCFAGGEFDPQVISRNDLAKYKTACKVLRNFFVSVNGIAHNRTGLQYVTPTYYSTFNQAAVLNVRLIPFQFSTSQTYVLEFGHYYMRVLKNGALVMNGSSAFIIPTVYPSTAVMGIGYTQSADTLFLAHPNYAPQILQRITDINWNIQPYDFQFGPYLLENTVSSYTITPSAFNLPLNDNSLVSVGTTVTLTASSYSTPDAFTKLLLHLDNNANDSSSGAKAVTNNNVTFINTIAQASYSGYFNGINAYLTTADSNDWFFGAGDFTVELWVYPTSITGQSDLVSQWADGNNYWRLELNDSANRTRFTVSSGGVTVADYACQLVSLNAWTRISVVRNGTNIYIFFNGVAQTLTTLNAIGSTSMPDIAAALVFGSRDGTLLFYSGLMDDIQVSKGIARNTENYTPASYTTFQSGHVGAFWKLDQFVPAQALESYSMTSSAPTTSIICGGTWRLITNGTWTGNIWVEKSTDAGLTWYKLAEFTGANNFNINTFGTEDMSNNAPPFLVRANSNGFSGTATITLTSDPFIQSGMVSITGIQSALVAYATVVQPIGINNRATANWSEGAWSIYRGWPTVVEFTPDDRLMWANSPYRPQTSWITKTSNYYNFNVDNPLVDSDAININLPSRQINGINGLLPLRAMLALTTSGEWSIESISGVSAPLTPSTVFQRVHGYEGSQGVRPVLIGIRGIFVQNLGKIIRDVGYELVYDSFVGADISVFSKHLFYFDTITDMCYCPNPDSLVWIVMASGALRSLTYLREQQVVTFARHDTQGKFMCTCSIADTINNYNVPYFVVNRANGQYIEFMPKRMNSQLIQDQFFVDSGGVYDALGQTFQNPDFETWSLGPSTFPDYWTLNQSSTVAQTSAPALTSSNLTTKVENGNYSAAVIGTMYQQMDQAYGIAYWKTRVCSFSAWVFCMTANQAMVQIADGVNTASVVHPGDSAWHYLTVNYTISSSATSVKAQIASLNGQVSYFDNAYFNSGVTQITGATWLNGQKISVLADGNVLAQRVVSGGVINLGASYNKIAYGLPYNCDLQPLNPNVDIPGGTMQGRVLKIGRSVVVVWNSASGYVGNNFNSMKPISELSGLTALSNIDAKCVVDGGYADDNSICIRQSDPLPMSVKSIVSEIQVGGIKPT